MKSIARVFHELSFEERFTYHCDAIDRGLSLDEALLQDSLTHASKLSPKKERHISLVRTQE